MELFSSPAFSFRSVENQQSTGAIKKVNTGQVAQRKPFSDRPVNSKTPLGNKSKGVQPVKPKLKNTVGKIIKPEEDLDANDFIFSYKEKEDYYSNIWSESVLGPDGINKILRSCYEISHKTPPPSPLTNDHELKIEPIFLDLPLCEFDLNKESLYIETVDEIDIPVLDDSFF